MPSAKIRCDFDQVRKVVGTFRSQNRDLTELLRRIRTSKEDLAGGRWIGKGATQFYAEMDNFILPSLHHLVQAMEGGACHLEQAGTLMHQADQDSAGLFKIRDDRGIHHGPGSGDVEPSGPGSGDEVPSTASTAEPMGPGSGDEEPSGPGSGDEVPSTASTAEPKGPGSGDVEPSGPGSGDEVPSTASTAEPRGPGSGDVEPSGPGSGDELPNA